MKKRRVIQIISAIAHNAYLPGILNLRLYSGKLKYVCLPGLNCYSCPGALGSCPIGATQAVLSSSGYRISYYMLGFFLIIGGLLGRLCCGLLCPFGLVQDLLHKIPFVKKIRTFKLDKPLRKLKYIILLVFVIILPLTLTNSAGGGAPYFCKWICPVGTLEGGLSLVPFDAGLRSIVGALFYYKLAILAVVVFLSIMIFRPFCKYICPLGAIYALFNRVSLYRYSLDDKKCTGCKKCDKACPMSINPSESINQTECIRCGVCKSTCPHGAIQSGMEKRT